MRTVLAPIAIVLICSVGCGKKAETSGAAATPPAAAPPAATPPAATPDAAVVVAPPDAKIDDNPRTSDLCTKVLAKIVACQHDKSFLTALDEGVDARQKKLNKRLLKEVAGWTYRDCVAIPTAVQYAGFLEHWDMIVEVPSALDSCGKLGTTLNSAGGLFGGDVAN
jgi:hypothetical protein